MTGPTVGLIMSGGGARAAYQVGVLRAISDMLPQRASNPFGIICGTSAGSVNAASLASDADRFDRAVARLARTWGTVHIGHVYRANLQGAISRLFRGVAAFVSAGLHGPLPGSLLDCGPLAALLGRKIDFARIRRTIAAGHLNAYFIPEERGGRQKAGLRTIETLVIRPSEPIAEITAAHVNELPRVMRWVMSRAGVLEPNGARVLSYLLFERGYCRHLMRLGFSDAMAQRERILSFLGYGSRFPRFREGGQAAPRVELGAA